ncbi:MAG: UvrD-helicase domain-containing protein, partial [Methanomassiliicoccales archaeon]
VRPDFTVARQELEKLLLLAGSYLPAQEPEKGWDGLQIKLRRAERWCRCFNLQDDRLLAELLQKLEGSAGVVQNRWANKQIALEMKAAFDYFQQQVAAPALDSWRQYCYQSVVEFLLPATQHYQQVRRQENLLNYQDLLLRTTIMLREDTEVRAYFQRRYHRLLVDEFQDTDPLQAEIMMYLSGDDSKEMDWTVIRPRPGALFVVGDPQQSIYRFRRADIDIFYQIQRQIKAAEGQVISLDRNFRSLPVVVEWVNSTFSSLLAEAEPPCQARYQVMVPERTAADGVLSGLMLINLSKEAHDSAAKIAAQDAQSIAAFISRTLAEPAMVLTASGELRAVAAEDFMVLVQVKKHLALYARELEVAGIPYSISGQNQINKSIPLLELQQLAKVVVDPANPVQLVAVLRGLFYGFSDQDLYVYSQAGGKFNYLANCPAALSSELKQKYTWAYEQLRGFRQAAWGMSPTSALELMAEQVGLLPLLLIQGGDSAAANYFLLTDHLRNAETKGVSRFDQLTLLMEQFMASGVEDELDLTYGQVKGVRLMNLHKAKGLEAAIVILADPGSQPGEGVDLYVQRQGRKSQGWLEVSEPIGEFSRRTLAYPPGWDELCDKESAYQAAERVRLLYVAATRAKDLLVVSNYLEKPDKSPWSSLIPYLAPAKILSGQQAIVVTAAQTAGVLLENEFALQKLERQQRLAQCQVPTSQVVTVTELAHQSSTPLPGSSGRGRGTAWGNVVHQALEQLAAYPERVGDRKWLISILQKHAYSGDEVLELQQLLTEVLSLDFWQRLRLATEVLTEVPFGIWEDGCYLKGTIDLVLHEAEGWVIADYKSDTIADDQALELLTEHYRSQVISYADCWQRLTGEKVKEVGILFTDIKCWVSLPL